MSAKATAPTSHASASSIEKAMEGLTPKQREAALFPHTGAGKPPAQRAKKHLVIEAGAGAGKTHVLALRAARLCDQRTGTVHPSRLFLVTFSRAADHELGERVRRTLTQADNETAARLVHVSTIDSLVHSLVETRYPIFWEEAARSLWAKPDAVQRYTPPTLTLLSDDLVKEKLEVRLGETLETLSADEGLCRVLCDFLLSGALARGFSFGPTSTKRHGGLLDGLLSAMLSEHLLCLDVPDFLIASARVHPGLPRLLSEVRALAQSCFAERLLKGTLTHTDASVFLYNLYCAPPEHRAGTMFDIHSGTDFPVAPEELIVDEYQDTSRIQHALLFRLATHRGGRMVVVGDPKQSIYGFRNAHVEVMETLKRDPAWHHVELTSNFRSDPLLLEEINRLSELSFSWEKGEAPAEFLASPYARSAFARRVGHKPLLAGRAQEVPPTRVRVDVISASLSDKQRPGPQKPGNGSLRRYLWDTFCEHVRTLGAERAVDGLPPWASVAVLCESRAQVREATRRLSAQGIPATALLSSTGGEGDLARTSFLRANLFLLHALHRSLDSVELFELLCSPLTRVPLDETLRYFSHFRDLACETFFERPDTFPRAATEGEGRVDWPALATFHTRLHDARACAPAFSFQAWQRLRSRGLEGLEHTLEEAFSDELAAFFHSWCGARQAIDNYVDLPATLTHWRIENALVEPGATDPNAVQVMTIHGAKGLEWPYVYFWPQKRRDESSDGRAFEIVSHETRPVVKWLARDTTTLGVLPWVDNGMAGPCSVNVSSSDGKTAKERHFTDLQKELEEAYERQRVFYTAFTRAREFLCFVHPLPAANGRRSLRDKLSDLETVQKGDYEKGEIRTLEDTVFARYLDDHFITGHVKQKDGRKVVKVCEEPWAGDDPIAVCPQKPWVRFIERNGANWTPTEDDDRFAGEDGGDDLSESDGTGESCAGDEQLCRQAALQEGAAAQDAGLSFWRWPLEVDRKEAEARVSHTTSIPVRKQTAAPLRARAKLNPYYERRLAAAEGVLYHVKQETALEAENPARLLRRVALRTWQELEIWHNGRVDGSGLLLGAPARNILDFLCYVTAGVFPRTYLEKDDAARVAALPADALVSCVLDFKTGLPKPEHTEQITQYMGLGAGLVKDGFGILTRPPQVLHIGLLCYDLARTEELDEAERGRVRERLAAGPGVALGHRYHVIATLSSDL